MDKRTELYIAKRYVAFVFAMLAVLGYPATMFFEVKQRNLLLLEVIIFIIGIGIVAYIARSRKKNSSRELRKQIRTIAFLLAIDTALQFFCVVLTIHLAVFVDMIYITVGFMAVILNLVSGEAVNSFMSRHLPDSARKRAWTYMIILLLLSNVAAVNRDISNPNVIIPIDEIIIILVSFVLLWLVRFVSLSTKKRLVKRDRWIATLVLFGLYSCLI
jgi:hypothetical protein